MDPLGLECLGEKSNWDLLWEVMNGKGIDGEWNEPKLGKATQKYLDAKRDAYLASGGNGRAGQARHGEAYRQAGNLQNAAEIAAAGGKAAAAEYDPRDPVNWVNFGGPLLGMAGDAARRTPANWVEKLDNSPGGGGDPVQTLWKAPQRGRAGAQQEMIDGYSAKNYPGDGPFFSTDRSVAEGYQRHYENGLQEVKILQKKYDQMANDGTIQTDSLEKASVHVPESGLGRFNDALQQGPSNTYHSQGG